jgi:hypothetical protein
MVEGRVRNSRMTLSGRIRLSLLTMALATGILMVVKNLPGVHFPMAMLMVFNFTHMGAAILFMVAALGRPDFQMALVYFERPLTATSFNALTCGRGSG